MELLTLYKKNKLIMVNNTNSNFIIEPIHYELSENFKKYIEMVVRSENLLMLYSELYLNNVKFNQ